MSEEKACHDITENAEPALVRIDFNDLISGEIEEDVYEGVVRAFGFDGFGGIIVTNAPDFKETKEKVQRNVYKLSQEPKEFLQSITKTDESGSYEIGWSEREIVSPFEKSSNKFVTFNQTFHSGTFYENAVFQDARLGKERESVWPTTIPQFQEDLTRLNGLVTPALLGLLKYFDRHLSDRTGKKQGKFVESFSESYACNHRLLIYSPLDEFGMDREDQNIWEHWHLDYSLMTTIAHPIYFTRQGERYELDSTALALKDRHGREHQSVFAQDEFIIIMSSAMFIESAGYIPATPHTVRISEGMPKDLYRVQAVSFFEPDYSHRMYIPTGESLQEIIERDPCKYNYRETDFYKAGCYFKEFNDEAFRVYTKTV